MSDDPRRTIFARSALLGRGWAQDVRIGIGGEGTVTAIETGAATQPGDEVHAVLVPGMGNLHSHAFQRGMAGLGEIRGPGDDSFWSWRKVMYEFALAFRPDELEAVAGQLYMEMLEAGFTRVGEFHYLHNDRDGGRYDDIAELAARIAAAATDTGISLTLLPVFYAHSGFGGLAPAQDQRRFIHSCDSYAELIAACRRIVAGLPGGRLGVAPHSLRAVTPQELTTILPLAQGGPVHIHIAEQVKEVEDCLAWSGARPVEWLLANAPVDSNWTLIHATHMSEAETRAMAKAGATAGLCPITEANLGDGVFPAPTFLDNGGAFGIGSDSNVLVSLPQELRQLEYSQRLMLRSRNVIARPGGSTGRRLFDEAIRGGGVSLHGAGHASIGDDADFVSLNVAAAPYLSLDAILDQWIFGRGVDVDTVWVRGRKCVEGGRHVLRDRLSARFVTAMTELLRRQG